MLGRRSHAGLATASAMLLGLVGGAREVQASCVAPTLSVDHSTAAAGDVVEIRGQYFGTGCNDIRVDGTFAGPPLGDPQKGIMLVIVQDDQVVPLGSVDANSNYEFGVRLAIPTGLHPGPVTIRVDPQDPVVGTSVLFTITNATTSTNSASPTTVLIGTATTVPSSAVPNNDSNRLSPWLWGVIGLGVVVVVVALVSRSRIRARRATADDRLGGDFDDET